MIYAVVRGHLGGIVVVVRWTRKGLAVEPTEMRPLVEEALAMRRAHGDPPSVPGVGQLNPDSPNGQVALLREVLGPESRVVATSRRWPSYGRLPPGAIGGPLPSVGRDSVSNHV